MIRDDYKTLQEILNKAIDSISIEDRNNIYRGWITGKKVSEFDYSLFYELLVVVTAILFIILWWNKKLAIEIDKRKIIEEQLKIANKIANDATKARGEFLANMSHEIRTPLNAIVGFIGLLKENINDKQNLEYLNIVDKSSHSLLGVINDILDFSKIENGKIELDYIDFDPKDEFESLSKLFDASCKDKNIDFQTNIDIKEKSLNSDILRLKQIISNLISNAVKFTHDNRSIKFNANYKEGMLSISIKDEGIGIPKKKLSTIFEAFTQAEESTTRRFGGTGLGLSISYELVKLLGGTLKVKSTLNKGSEFYFSIPVKVGENIKKSNEANKAVKFKGSVLLVEDNKANQMFMKIILKKFGFSFDIANDGMEAVDMYKEYHLKYDCILMDENMPNMGGIEAVKHIIDYEKQNNITHTPIIALTANALKGDKERFLEAGMDYYLSKPVDKEKLIIILDKIFKG
ncbi:MAG: ATP-binding protein [Campylobacterota bacterium]|nr:ATP-binding protein [Campylobacterota bacterium]